MSAETIPAHHRDPHAIPEEEKHKTLKRVTFSSFLGNFIEWFDYASYSYLATVIALVFFPGEDRMVATMMTFGVFALAFLVRPIGAIFWGNMGDKKGRKWALSVSILLMSGSTFLIGCCCCAWCRVSRRRENMRVLRPSSRNTLRRTIAASIARWCRLLQLPACW